MRYGQPAIAAELDALCAEGATRILVLPAYPQYSAATTASVLDDVGDWIARTRRVPELRFVNHYHDDPGYIDALAAQVRKHWQREGRGRKLVMSFHGMPERTLLLGDPYHCECLKTGAPAGRAAAAGRRRLARHVPEPLRPRRVAAALHRADARRRWPRAASRAST